MPLPTHSHHPGPAENAKHTLNAGRQIANQVKHVNHHDRPKGSLRKGEENSISLNQVGETIFTRLFFHKPSHHPAGEVNTNNRQAECAQRPGDPACPHPDLQDLVLGR
jgi:hypothetical protein